MRIPQDRTRTGRNSPGNKPDFKWSDDQIYTHPTNTLSILIKAIQLTNNTSPAKQHPLPPNQQTSQNFHAGALLNERSTHHAARRANASAVDSKKYQTMSNDAGDHDPKPAIEPPQPWGEANRRNGENPATMTTATSPLSHHPIVKEHRPNCPRTLLETMLRTAPLGRE